MLLALSLVACGDDDDDKNDSGTSSLVGKWALTQDFSDGDETDNVSMELVFNKDNTGVITETWIYESRASSREVYKMEFSWSTTKDSSGNDIMRISYVSGDKDTEIFNGGSGTVLWTRQYVRTGNILNIYSGSSNVWVFNKK